MAPEAARAPRVIVVDPADAEEALAAALGWPDFVTPDSQASHRLSRGQIVSSVVVGVAVVAALAIAPIGTLVTLMALCTVVYLATILHRVMAFRSSQTSDPFLRISDDEARAVPDDQLPTYTVLVPAFGEPEVIPGLVKAMERLEYPRDRLSVKLLLEAGDTETLDAALGLESVVSIDILVVPAGRPQTKPRALNYGLLWSSSDLVTIYDAEDRPEPLQLRRAAVAMGGLSDRWACLQARLEFYEAEHNLLTRFFCLEYLTWFTCFLPGMVNEKGVVPLGGTSNHFRYDALVRVGAWDPYNVTEDADLGIRLQRFGYRIGVIDSVTYEEPNSDVINWVKQRSRWQKGYLQTALVHLRRPRRLVDEMGWRGVGHLLLFVGGTPLLAVANLLFWSMFLVYLATGAQIIRDVYPAWSFYFAVAAWGIGNFMISYLGVVTVLVTRRSELIVAALLAPLYWVIMSLAALRALIQFVVDPSYWEKTQHGLNRPGYVPRPEVAEYPVNDPAEQPEGGGGRQDERPAAVEGPAAATA